MKLNKAQIITFSGLLLALGVIPNLLSLPRTPLGNVSFVYLFAYLSGIILGPWWGAVVAALADIIAHFIAPKGPYIPLITVSNALMALIMGISFKYLKTHSFVKIFIGIILSFGICNLGITPFALYQMGYIPSIKLSIISRLTFQPFWIVMNVIVMYLILKALDKSIFKGEIFKRNKEQSVQTEQTEQM